MGARSRILRLFLTDVDRERAWEEVRSRVPGTKLLDDRLISLPLPAEAIVDSPSQIAGPMLVLWSPEVDPGYATRTSPRGLNQPDGGIISWHKLSRRPDGAVQPDQVSAVWDPEFESMTRFFDEVAKALRAVTPGRVTYFDGTTVPSVRVGADAVQRPLAGEIALGEGVANYRAVEGRRGKKA